MNYNKEIAETLNDLKISLENLENNINEFTSYIFSALDIYCNTDIDMINDIYTSLSSIIENLITDIDSSDTFYINESQYVYLNTKINNFIEYIDELDINDLNQNLYDKIEIEFNNFITILQTNNII
jgi:hypothetical protein